MDEIVDLTATEEAALGALIAEELRATPDQLQELSADLGIRREVSTRELAEVLGITARRVEQLAADGWIPSSPRQDRRGLSFDLLEAVRSYVDFLRG